MQRVLLMFWISVQRVSNIIFHKIIFAPLRLMFRVTIVGKENLPRRGGYFIASNHQSGFDPVVLAIYHTWRSISFMAKSSLWTKGILKWTLGPLLSLAMQVPVDRRDPAKALASTKRAERIALNGDIVGIFPGATRTMDNRVPQGRFGVIRMAMHTGLPIVPIGIIGMDGIQKISDISIWKPAKIKIVIGKPVSFAVIAEPTKAQLDNGIGQLMPKIAHLSEREYVNERAQHG